MAHAHAVRTKDNVRVSPHPSGTVFDLEERMICLKIAPRYETVVVLARSVDNKNLRLDEP